MQLDARWVAAGGVRGEEVNALPKAWTIAQVRNSQVYDRRRSFTLCVPVVAKLSPRADDLYPACTERKAREQQAVGKNTRFPIRSLTLVEKIVRATQLCCEEDSSAS